MLKLTLLVSELFIRQYTSDNKPEHLTPTLYDLKFTSCSSNVDQIWPKAYLNYTAASKGQPRVPENHDKNNLIMQYTLGNTQVKNYIT